MDVAEIGPEDVLIREPMGVVAKSEFNAEVVWSIGEMISVGVSRIRVVASSVLSAVPQLRQNLLPSTFVVPQCEHARGEFGLCI